MKSPVRIQRRRAKGWEMPEGAVYVGRGSPWGNPFVVGVDGTKADCVRLYKWLLTGHLCLSCKAPVEDQKRVLRHTQAHIGELRGKDLACWCPPDAPCHADVLLKAANADSLPVEIAPDELLAQTTGR
jgi:hypothetical protein